MRCFLFFFIFRVAKTQLNHWTIFFGMWQSHVMEWYYWLNIVMVLLTLYYYGFNSWVWQCSIHQKSPTSYQKSPAFHQKSSTFHQKSPTFHQNSPTFHWKSPTFHQKSPAFNPKSLTFHQKRPRFHQKSPAFHLKKRISNVMVLIIECDSVASIKRGPHLIKRAPHFTWRNVYLMSN